MRCITLFYDPTLLSPTAQGWIRSEEKYVPIHFVSSRDPRLAAIAPGLDPATLTEHLLAVDDEGRVWRDGKAELLVLWALRRYRGRALRIRHPSRLPFMRLNLNWVAGGVGEPWPDRSARGSRWNT